MSKRWSGLLTAVCFVFSAAANPLAAATFGTINLIDEFAAAGSFSGGSFDILDATGVAGMDGVDDVTIIVTTSGAGVVNGVTGAASWDVSSSGIRVSESFSGDVASNNPGTRLTAVLVLELADHLTVAAEDFEIDFSSLNTAGIAWEHSHIEFLDENGAAFSAVASHAAYLAHTAIDGAGTTGNYHADSLGTVTGVGTSQTVSGSSGGNNNLTSAPGGDLDGTEVGISAGTRIGGIRMTTYLDDVRGTLNNNTSFTSTLTEVSISGEITPPPVPEPSSGVLLMTGAGLLLMRRRPRR